MDVFVYFYDSHLFFPHFFIHFGAFWIYKVKIWNIFHELCLFELCKYLSKTTIKMKKNQISANIDSDIAPNFQMVSSTGEFLFEHFRINSEDDIVLNQ